MAAPLPETVRGPVVDRSKGYLVEEIRDGVYWVTEGAYQVMFVTTGEGVIVVDAPPSIGEYVLAAIGEVTSEPVTHVVYSHSHSDHIGAASMYPPEATIVAHEATAEILRRHADPRRPLPTETFTDRHVLRVGRQELVLEYRGVNHEPGNVFIHAPRQRVLMVVDVFFPGWIPFKNCAMTEDVPGFYRAHDEALRYDFETLVAGHLTRLGTPDDVRVQREYFADVREACVRAMGSIDWMEVAQDTGWENLWLLFDTYLDRIARAAADEVESRWVGRLGAVDVFTEDHCWTVMESLRIDEGFLPGPRGVVEERSWWTARR